jgi:aminopeptidase YwaD
MKNSSVKTFRSITVISIIVLLCASTVSLTSAQRQDRSTLLFEKPTSSGSNQKIDQVLSLIDQDLLLGYLKILVGYGTRMDGTFNCELAGRYIDKQFTTMGLTSRVQNWSAWGNYHYHYVYDGQNIEGTLPGVDTNDNSALLFNAHYDSVAAGPGANDDGSGTVAVLAAAYALSHFTFQRTIKFVTFSGEEVGLLGAQAYTKEAYQRNDSILLEINADMIGHDTGSNTMRVTTTEDAGWAGDIFQMINQNYSIGLTINRGAINRVNHKLSGSDYSTFLQYGWESLCCWETDPDVNFHSAKDNLSNVNLSYLVNTTRTIAGALAYMADLPEPEIPPQVRIISPRVGYLYNAGMKKQGLGKFKTTVINDIWIWADVEHATAPIQRAEFYYDGKLVFTDTEEPYIWHFNKISLRKHDITVIVYDQLGRNSTDWRQIRFINLLLKN